MGNGTSLTSERPRSSFVEIPTKNRKKTGKIPLGSFFPGIRSTGKGKFPRIRGDPEVFQGKFQPCCLPIKVYLGLSGISSGGGGERRELEEKNPGKSGKEKWDLESWEFHGAGASGGAGKSGKSREFRDGIAVIRELLREWEFPWISWDSTANFPGFDCKFPGIWPRISRDLAPDFPGFDHGFPGIHPGISRDLAPDFPGFTCGFPGIWPRISRDSKPWGRLREPGKLRGFWDRRFQPRSHGLGFLTLGSSNFPWTEIPNPKKFPHFLGSGFPIPENSQFSLVRDSQSQKFPDFPGFGFLTLGSSSFSWIRIPNPKKFLIFPGSGFPIPKNSWISLVRDSQSQKIPGFPWIWIPDLGKLQFFLDQDSQSQKIPDFPWIRIPNPKKTGRNQRSSRKIPENPPEVPKAPIPGGIFPGFFHGFPIIFPKIFPRFFQDFPIIFAKIFPCFFP
ncbi:uncharacterized protein LOC131578859 [Poecile atricapillus]|uniref:uncharacterized protein LOC131578859 n=1 Tax=Poecile atricapillus TaxID=48891 RepID=UPI002738C424|nr:uncharacterized protein LOC131578859 [Poecile atricapillus]